MQRIVDKLREIEQRENVQIFYACESGSRAWGFPSADSDYDVRFLYIRELSWYLSTDVEDRRDVIEEPILDDLDVNGWDLRKALKLLRKSNPPLLEWLSSPTVYFQDEPLISRFRDLAAVCYSPVACTHHYLQMAQGNFREYLKGDEVTVKKYFYVLRPLLAIRWIEQCSDIVPMEFGSLVDRLVDEPILKSEIQKLIERKKRGEELTREPKIGVISDFIVSEMERLGSKSVDERGDMPTRLLLNQVFREMLDLSKIGA